VRGKSYCCATIIGSGYAAAAAARIPTCQIGGWQQLGMNCGSQQHWPEHSAHYPKEGPHVGHTPF
jgi:hypothetical protein